MTVVVRRGLAIAAAVLVLAVPAELPGCGGGTPTALFVLTRQPEDAEGFLGGKLGIVQRSYGTQHLVIAYRYLSGVGLSEAERAALAAPEEKPGDSSEWVIARGKVDGKTVAAYRPVVQPGYFAIWLNCGTDAFRTAARTLGERQQRFGIGSALLTEWVRGQDMVFANCEGGKWIPDAIGEGPLRADREYQRAAAKFYAGQYDDARADFERIALDGESTWREGAPYLAARCLIRAGSYGEADARLAQVEADASRTAWHERARRLRNYLALRIRPKERVRELGESLASSHAEGTIKQDLIDYSRWVREESGGDELSQWIRGLDRTQGLEKWRGTRNVAWLLAALWDTQRGDAEAEELAEAAGALDRGHPGYVSVTYEALRLMPEDRARVKAAELLSMGLPAGSRNLVLAARMGMARSWNEFLRDAPREVVGEMGMDGESAGGEPGRYLGYDAGAVMNQGVPVAMLEAASQSRQLPAEVRAELARTVAARKLVLAESPEFDGVLGLLRSPGTSPWVRSGYGRRLFAYRGEVRYYYDASRLEDYRDNWWAAWERPGEVKAPGFLSAEERRQGAAEWKKLRALPSGTRWLGEQTLKFATAHPEDPRVPEALYRVVRASRYGVPDGEISKKAFRVLHGRYEGSEWAKRTPYWFK